MHRITVGARFNGPPGVGNGGYVCGLVAACFDGPTEVTLQAPPPLERPLAVVRDGGGVSVRDGETLVARAVPANVEVRPPAFIPLDDAERASAAYAGFTSHPFPSCFVCGPRRAAGDGLRLFPGPVEGTSVVAAPWTPSGELAGPDGAVHPEVVWAALDCPSYFGGVPGGVALLGRLAAELRAPVLAGTPQVVLGWGIGSRGRRHAAGAAVTDADGRVLAVSRATWVELRERR